MDDTSKAPVSGIKKSNKRYQSDVVVDMIKRYGFEHIALNPGASYRGLHDSLVNYGENDPPMMLCTHEKIAVQIAHGYARHSGKPMIAIVHNLVGLLHAPMGIYYAYIDRAPVFIMGATGPLNEPKRRPYIDWIHSANVQGEAIRDYVKWDYQPASVDGIPDSFARAYSVMMSGKQGPIYMCYDAGLQEGELDREVRMPPAGAVTMTAPPAPDPTALAKAADTLAKAERPVIVADFAARPPHGWDHVVAIAETLGARVWDCNSRLNFPGNHPLNLSMAPEECYGGADVVLTLDINDFEKPTFVRDIATRTVKSQVPDDATWIDIGFTDTEISKWAMAYARTYHAEQRMHADPVTATPLLTGLLKERIAATPGLAEKIAKRTEETGKVHRKLREGWMKTAQENWDLQPMTVGRLALEVWDKIKDEDWVLTAGTMHDWARRLWDFDRPYCHGGGELGTGTQIGTSLGVALANKGTGRLVIDLQPDGDLMFDAGSLWMAAKYEIPMLIVMYNNRAYYNDWNHQIVIAKNRGTDPARAHIGMDLYDPDPDFAGLARSMGWWAEGPILSGDDVGPALERAIAQVKQGKPALVDTVCQRGKLSPNT
jgi:acetolactate synthase-1/2/3 large subunit